MNKIRKLLCILIVYYFLLGVASIYSVTSVYAYITTPVATTTTVAGTYYKLEGTFNNSVIEGFAIETDILTYKGDPGNFIIMYAGTFSSNTVQTVVTLGLFKNGTLVTGTGRDVLIKLTDDLPEIAAFTVVNLQEGDTLQLRIKSDQAGAQITAQQGQTAALRLF